MTLETQKSLWSSRTVHRWPIGYQGKASKGLEASLTAELPRGETAVSQLDTGKSVGNRGRRERRGMGGTASEESEILEELRHGRGSTLVLYDHYGVQPWGTEPLS